jgi:hypothetical protein
VKTKQVAKYEITLKKKTPAQVARKKARKSTVARHERRAKDRADKAAAIKAEMDAIAEKDAKKMQEKMEAPIPETSADPLNDAIAPGQDVQTTSL